MIIVRNIFQLKFGHAKEAKALIPEGRQIMKQHGMENARFTTDITGPFYTLEMELPFESLGAYEKSASETMGTREFSTWYAKFIEHVESGRREIYSVV